MERRLKHPLTSIGDRGRISAGADYVEHKTNAREMNERERRACEWREIPEELSLHPTWLAGALQLSRRTVQETEAGRVSPRMSTLRKFRDLKLKHEADGGRVINRPVSGLERPRREVQLPRPIRTRHCCRVMRPSAKLGNSLQHFNPHPTMQPGEAISREHPLSGPVKFGRHSIDIIAKSN